jgi:hypothetical protein
MTTRRFAIFFALLALAASFFALSACGDDDDETADEPTATSAAATAEPTPATPGGSDETPTGSGNIPEVDDIVDAVLSNDAAQIRPRVRFDVIACEVAPGMGGPPPCREGEESGTQVNVVEIGTCEGEYRRADEMDGLADMLDAETLFGVYEGPATQGPDGDYVAVFTRTTGGDDGAVAVTIDGGIIVYFKFSCGETPQELVDVLGLGEPLAFTPPT